MGSLFTPFQIPKKIHTMHIHVLILLIKNQLGHRMIILYYLSYSYFI